MATLGLVTWIPCLGTFSLLPAYPPVPTSRRAFTGPSTPAFSLLHFPHPTLLKLGPPPLTCAPGLTRRSPRTPPSLPVPPSLHSVPPPPARESRSVLPPPIRESPGGRAKPRGHQAPAPVPPTPGISARSPGPSAAALCQRGSRSARGSCSSTWTRTRLAAAGG